MVISNRDVYMRNKNDYYPTPHWCFDKLPIDWSIFSTALEPCSGDGRIVKFLESKGLDVDWREISQDMDYLTEECDKVDLILTNPPFSLAIEFIEKALKESDTVIMLLRINFLGSQIRHSFWKLNSPTGMVVLSKRPSFTGTGTDCTDYAWFIWDKTGKLPTGIDFIK